MAYVTRQVYENPWGGLSYDAALAQRSGWKLLGTQSVDDQGNIVSDSSSAPWLTGASGIDYSSIGSSGGYAVDPNTGVPLGPNGEPMYSDATTPWYSGVSGYGVPNTAYGDAYSSSSTITGYDSSGQPIFSPTSTSTNGGTSTIGGSTGGGFTVSGTSGGYGLVAPQPLSTTSFSSGGSGGGGGSGVGGKNIYDSTGGGNFSALTGTGMDRNVVGSTSTQPTTNIYAPSGASYLEAMNAELSELDKGMVEVRKALQDGRIQNNSQLQSALQSLSNQYGVGINELTNQFNQSINQYNPITQGMAQDVARLREGTYSGFDDDFKRFTESQAYKFPLEQAIGQIEGSQAARGMLKSSDTLKNIGQYASDYGTGQYNQYRQNRLNELGNLANLSIGATGQQTGLRTQLGTSQLGARTSLGQTQANTQLGFAGYNTDLAKSGAEAVGQYYTARADARNRGIVGRGTKAIEINV